MNAISCTFYLLLISLLYTVTHARIMGLQEKNFCTSKLHVKYVKFCTMRKVPAIQI